MNAFKSSVDFSCGFLSRGLLNAVCQGPEKNLGKGLFYENFLTKSGARAHLVKIDSTLYTPEIIAQEAQNLLSFQILLIPINTL